MDEDVTVLRDEIQAYDDGTVARVRVLSVPTSDRFPEGVNMPFTTGEQARTLQSSGTPTTTGRTKSTVGRRWRILTSPASRTSTGGGARNSPRTNRTTGDHQCHEHSM
jgi:hypothetical protein